MTKASSEKHDPIKGTNSKTNHSFNYHKVSMYKIGTKKEKYSSMTVGTPWKIAHLLNFVGDANF